MLYEAYFKDELLKINPNYGETSDTFKKYVLEAPTDNKENADKDEAKQNESNEVGN